MSKFKRSVIISFITLSVGVISPVKSNAWFVESENDGLTNYVNAVTFFQPGTGATDEYEMLDQESDWFALNVRCKDKVLAVYIFAKETYNYQASVKTTKIRFSTGPVKSWRVSASDNGMFFQDPKKLLPSLLKSSSLLVGNLSNRGLMTTSKFSVSDLATLRAKFKKVGCSI